ncbi:hypothetical protein [Paenibacillus ferrarius]|uniref:hypothetical protein n=1 Tax=Paenibacillus ferrarius TaxID=1469647 RepID=UPI003D27B408
MAWITLLDRDRLTLRLDEHDQSLMLEVNDGGISPTYVTLHLDRSEAGVLEDALRAYRAKIGENSDE